jgi:tetratricopeptide (TPR) repeat protein
MILDEIVCHYNLDCKFRFPTYASMTKLLRSFEKHLSQGVDEEPSSRCCASKCILAVRSDYAPTTLVRLLASQQAEMRQAAAWALTYLGDESHFASLGALLRDSVRSVRSYADEARRAIQWRTQSPWHRKTASKIEQLLADGFFLSASKLSDHLVDEADRRADVYMLRAWVRFTDGQIETAIEDCKRTLALDPFCYQACLALGQCLWHKGQDLAARECYFEAAKIYPDWEPARAALHWLANR